MRLLKSMSAMLRNVQRAQHLLGASREKDRYGVDRLVQAMLLMKAAKRKANWRTGTKLGDTGIRAEVVELWTYSPLLWAPF